MGAPPSPPPPPTVAQRLPPTPSPTSRPRPGPPPEQAPAAQPGGRVREPAAPAWAWRQPRPGGTQPPPPQEPPRGLPTPASPFPCPLHKPRLLPAAGTELGAARPHEPVPSRQGYGDVAGDSPQTPPKMPQPRLASRLGLLAEQTRLLLHGKAPARPRLLRPWVWGSHPAALSPAEAGRGRGTEAGGRGRRPPGQCSFLRRWPGLPAPRGAGRPPARLRPRRPLPTDLERPTRPPAKPGTRSHNIGDPRGPAASRRGSW